MCPHGSDSKSKESERKALEEAFAHDEEIIDDKDLPEDAVEKEQKPPKPENEIAPGEALNRIIEGNKRYIEGVARRHDFVNEREALVGGQNPYVAVLSCADSRIAPEYAFDSGRGDVFAVRVAGNYVTTDGLASLEYAVAVLRTPLLIVLGHERCGAIDAAVKCVKDDVRFPGQIGRLAEALSPVVKHVLDEAGDDTTDRTIIKNIEESVKDLTERSEILAAAVKENALKIVGGIYRLKTGKVDFIV